MTIEYIGELLSDHHLSVSPSVLTVLPKGRPLRITIEPVYEPPEKDVSGNKGIDTATQRFLNRLENAPNLGQMKSGMSRVDIYEEMADDKF